MQNIILSNFTIEDINDNKDINDINDRKRRTVIIIDYLQKTICGSNDDVLSQQVISIIEGIFK